MAKVITKEDVQAACGKAAAKATAQETKRCVTAIKDVSADDYDSVKKFKAAVIVAVKS